MTVKCHLRKENIMVLNEKLRQEEMDYLRSLVKAPEKDYEDVANLVECVQLIEGLVVYHLAPQEVLEDPARLTFCALKLMTNFDLKQSVYNLLTLSSYAFDIQKFKNTYRNMSKVYHL